MTKTLSLRNTLSGAVLALLLATAAILPITALADSDKSSQNGTRAEVAMTADGKILVRGAKVTSLSGSTVNASVTLGSQTLHWVVSTDVNTQFLNVRGGASNLAAIAVNDIVSFAGTLNSTGSPFSVSAQAVKDWTPVASEGKASGLITSIDGANSKLVIDKKNGKGEQKLLTIQFNASTTVTLNGSASTFGALQVNDGLRVTGTLSADGMTLAASTVVASRPADLEDRRFSKMWKAWFSGKNFFKF